MKLFAFFVALVGSVVTLAPPSTSSSDRTTVEGSLVLKGKALQEYYSLYENPSVLAVRSYLDRYLKNDLKDWGAANVAIQGIQKDKTDGLANFDKSYYQSKFFVVEVEPFVGGGQTVSVIFQDKPDKMFDVWMYHLSKGEFEMRAFTWDKSISAKDIPVVYKNFIADKTHAL